MDGSGLVLGRLCRGDSFRHKVAAHVRGVAEVAASALPGPGVAHTREVCESLARYVEILPPESQALRALEFLSGCTGFEAPYAPGPEASRFFAGLGRDAQVADPSAMLEELVGVTVEDALAESAKRLASAGLRDDLHREIAERGKAVEARNVALEAEVGELESRLAEKTRESKVFQGKWSYAKDRLNREEGDGEPAVKAVAA